MLAQEALRAIGATNEDYVFLARHFEIEKATDWAQHFRKPQHHHKACSTGGWTTHDVHTRKVVDVKKLGHHNWKGRKISPPRNESCSLLEFYLYNIINTGQAHRACADNTSAAQACHRETSSTVVYLHLKVNGSFLCAQGSL